MKALRPLSVLLFALVAWADVRVHDWLGFAFWAVAFVIFGALLFGKEHRRWINVTWGVLTVFAIAVAIIRLGFGFTG